MLQRHPVIPAVRRPEDLERALASPAGALFLLAADLLSLGEVVARCRRAGKRVFVHLDLVEGLSADRAGVLYVARRVAPDGVISTRSAVVRLAQELRLGAILRVFALDSAALATALEVIRRTGPDAVEVLPATLPPWVFARLREAFGGPVIAGGLVVSPDDVRAALASGATAVSASRPELWAPLPGRQEPGVTPRIPSVPEPPPA